MALYSINTAEMIAENFLAGEYPIVTDIGTIKEKTTIHKYAPVIQGESGIEEFTAEMLSTSLDKLAGIAADAPSGNEVVIFLTGEFFGEGLTLPDGVTAADLKPAFRKLGIFIKEM